MLQLRVQAFSLPKHGHQLEEYEDAWAYDVAASRLALADGASDAFESRLWARALVQAFIREPPTLDDEALLRWLDAPIQVWRAGIHWERLTYYEERKARGGAFATLLGVSFVWPATDDIGNAGDAAQWQAMAVGDACLFQIRGEEVIAHFPIERATDFNMTPPLLSTQMGYTRRSLEALQTCAGECSPGDLFVLATDALAAWFLRQVEECKHPWRYLIEMTDDTFTTLMGHLRQERAIQNDDVTLVLGWVDPQLDADIHG